MNPDVNPPVGNGQETPSGQAPMPSRPTNPIKPAKRKAKPWRLRFRRRVDAIPLSTKLVACIIVLLTVGTIGISFSIRTLVGNYLLQKTDTQLVNQAQLIFNSMDSLYTGTDNDGRSLMNTYYVEVRDGNYKSTGAGSVPMLRDGVVSEPSLPADGSIDGITLGQPFTTQAVVHVTSDRVPDHSIMQAAQSPWRVVALPWSEKGKDGHVKNSGVVFIGLSLSDQIDTANTLTRFCAMVGIAVVLIGAILGTFVVQSTLAPLKRIEKTAAKIAAGDLSQRVPDLPENTEVGSLSVSLNAMLTRIEESFHAQEETTEKMKRFVSDASHELKTPLAGIRLLTDSILQTDHMDEETTKEFVTDIGREAERLSRITENLLRLTRLDSGVVQQPYPVAVAPVMERVERMLHMVAQEKGVTISGTADEDAVALATDDDVHQILYNLMENAIKYSAAEGGFVRAEAHVDGDKVVLTVSDNGIGIPDEDLPHIFDRFYRVDKMRSREVGGTGLGLSIVKDTIENRGGTISAGHGADGVGTVFTVYLPLAERGEEA